MAKRKLSKKEWILFITCIIIVTTALVVISTREVLLKFSNLTDEVKNNEAQLAKLYQILNEQTSIESEYEKTFRGLRQIQSSDDLLQEIESFAAELGLNIRNIKPTATKEEDLYTLFSVKVEVQDEVSKLAKFLHAFTGEFKGVGVKRLEIDAQRKNELPTASLLLNAVAFKQDLSASQK